ncbi:MAG: lysine 2,3-aminomutase [Pirellulaceae bacterium]|jgi:lysine 2,3-aminomutase
MRVILGFLCALAFLQCDWGTTDTSTIQEVLVLPPVTEFANSIEANDIPARRVKYVQLSKIEQLSEYEREQLELVSKKFAFRVNDYYLDLIDWDDPQDPIRQLVIPRLEELNDWGELDASNELSVTVTRGVQHKYTDTVLLLCNEVCGAYCRYCFRKRLFMTDNDEATNDVTEGIRYISEHPEVNNVLLTGGDPLLMSPRRLREIISALREIDHVKIIRLGSKMPAFDPWRILHNEETQKTFRDFSYGDKRIYLMAHFDHPRELTPEAVAGLHAAMECGVICVNQCPLIRGINDNADVLAEMYAKLSFIGCPPYYLFQGRPTEGNESYEVPIVEGWNIFNDALKQGSGLARRARYAMSHETGKVQILAVDDNFIYMRYHEAKDPQNIGRFMVFHRNDEAYWLDQLEPVGSLMAN